MSETEPEVVPRPALSEDHSAEAPDGGETPDGSNICVLICIDNGYILLFSLCNNSTS